MPSDATRRVWRWFVFGAVLGAVAGGLLTALLRVSEEIEPAWYVVAIVALCGAAAGALRAVAGRPVIPSALPHGTPPRPEHGLAALDQMADRITRATARRSSYVRGLQPVLRDLVDDRMQRRTGAGLAATDPQRARQLLGEPLWHWLQVGNEPGVGTMPPPTAQDLEILVSRIEAL